METSIPIKVFPGYAATPNGEIISYKHQKPRYIKKHFGKGDYYRVWLYDGRGKKHDLFVHRLIAETFIQNPENKPCVNHSNGIKTDNRVENLEWVTYAENSNHAYYTGLSLQGSARPQAKLTEEQVIYIRTVYKPRDKNFGIKPLAEKFGVGRSTIQRIVHGVCYPLVGGKIHGKYGAKHKA